MRSWGGFARGGLAALLAAGAASAQQASAPVPDQVIFITTDLGQDDPNSSFFPGSIFDGIESANALTNQSNIDYVSLTVSESLLNLSILLEDPLPAIDLARSPSATTDPRVDIDGSIAPAFVLTTADDVPTDFVLLHVMAGRADLVDLDIRSGLVDIDGDPVALTVQVDPNATLGFRYEEDFGFDENIIGGGGVIIQSQGVITFSGTNNYTGGTQVISGALRGNTASLRGDFTLDESTRLDFQIDDTNLIHLFAGNVDGKGRLVKSGLGTLSIAGGAATHTGGTEVALGTLQVTPDTLTGAVDVANSAQLWIMQEASTDFAGVISGAGSVRKSGTMPLVLTGANTFGGGLFVADGDVRGTTASVPGNISLEAAVPPSPTSRMIFDQDFAGTHTGTVSGTGVLRKEGTGRVLRQGLTAVDLTQIAAGTLAGDTVALGSTIEVAAAGATAEFLVNDVQSFGGSLSGPGDVTKTGAGTLVLSSDALHMGQTVVASGVLQLDADLTSSTLVRVDAGGRLTNTVGMIGVGDLQNFGRVAPGGTATLSVGGNATLAAGSVLELSVDDAGNSSRLAVSGTASLAAPSYELDLASGDYSAPVAFTVVSAGAIALGSMPGQALDDLAFVNVVSAPAFVGNTVQLSIQEDFTNLGALGTTPNQVSTAIALEQVTNSGSADARVIRDGLVPLRTSQAPAVLDMMAGETLSAFTNSRVANALYFADAISRRLHASNWELTRPPALAPGQRPPPVSAPRTRGGPGGWIEPFGIFSDNQGRGNASDIDTNAFGVSGGLDYRLPQRLRLSHSEYWRFGLAAGYTRHSLENGTGFMTGSGNTVQTALYAGYRSPRFHAGAAGRFAWSGMESDRRIAFTTVDRHAYGSFDGMEWGALVEAGGHFGDRRRAQVHPFARFQYLRTTQDAFNEVGAGDLSLAVPELSYDSLLLTLGARVSRVFTLKGEFGIEPELRAAWTIDYGDRGRHVPAAFYNVPGATPFVTAGTEPDRNGVAVGLGYVMRIGDLPLLSTHYDVQFGEYHTTHVLSAGILLRW